ncbi:hypothetical protein KUH180129_2506 [Staphylococcus aureus]|uniref:HNH endonuclease n=1 Tax=Staphylococcus aureus TaxID=1280 RepID=UPI001259FD20|nr:HNH endonuclease signature motif containing protein [Staphylococcus aureus]BBN42047.1 hypothetical protein KUH180129_2506 [Staphylococcus aureus]
MVGDHIIPWSKGGKTERGNLQMLYKHHNSLKSNTSNKLIIYYIRKIILSCCS